MNFFRKSIVRRLFLNLLLLMVFAGGIFYYFFKNDKSFTLNVPFYYILAGVFIFLVFLVLSYYFDIVRPLHVILAQVQALLTGKPYKRIYTTRVDEVGVLAHFFNKVTEGFSIVADDIKDRDRMLGELTVASQLQADILPLHVPGVPGLQIVAKYKPASELGGDSFNFIEAKGKTYIYVGDVTGHGAAASIIMTMVNSLVSVFADLCDNAYEVVVNVNKYVKRWVKKAMYMTFLILCWDPKTEKMTFVGAGHEHILVFRAASGDCEAILSGGIALGMLPDNSKVVKEQELVLNEGDCVALFSDGLTEAKNVAGALFGLENLQRSFMEHAAQYSAEGVNFHIAKDVSEFMKGHQQEDDMTLIIIKRDKNFDAKTVSPSASLTNWSLSYDDKDK